MKTEKNKQIWIEKVHENLILRGRSEATFINYKSALKRFLDFYSQETKIKNLKVNIWILILVHFLEKDMLLLIF